ncbi:hypothetical protein [Halococcus sp. PRR34]|uniref:hypothetical protein n=1 Tax=Halococcus sp. PRR34 TaxID=3020830 RepID=UPI00235ED585|nr:hypothetical protein [Halococcus sp. PRR34]
MTQARVRCACGARRYVPGRDDAEDWAGSHKEECAHRPTTPPKFEINVSDD